MVLCKRRERWWIKHEHQIVNSLRAFASLMGSFNYVLTIYELSTKINFCSKLQLHSLKGKMQSPFWIIFYETFKTVLQSWEFLIIYESSESRSKSLNFFELIFARGCSKMYKNAEEWRFKRLTGGDLNSFLSTPLQLSPRTRPRIHPFQRFMKQCRRKFFTCKTVAFLFSRFKTQIFAIIFLLISSRMCLHERQRKKLAEHEK